MKWDYLTAIVIVVDPATGAISSRKYRNIRSTDEKMMRFERFAFKIPGSKDLNYYFPDKSFYKQIRNPAFYAPPL